MLAVFAVPVFSGGQGEAVGAKKQLVISKIPITMEFNYHQALWYL